MRPVISIGNKLDPFCLGDRNELKINIFFFLLTFPPLTKGRIPASWQREDPERVPSPAVEGVLPSAFYPARNSRMRSKALAFRKHHAILPSDILKSAGNGFPVMNSFQQRGSRNIESYVTDWCPVCASVLDWMKANDIPFASVGIKHLPMGIRKKSYRRAEETAGAFRHSNMAENG